MSETDTHGPDLIHRLSKYIASLAVIGISIHLVLRFGLTLPAQYHNIPLLVVLLLGGTPLVVDLFLKLLRWEVGSDLLAGISIVVSLFLDEYLAGSLVVLMLSGGEALESYAMVRASSVLEALAKRMPSIAHRRLDSRLEDISLEDIKIGDQIVILPHEVSPVDGIVLEGRGSMDEAYLTGEPFRIPKTPGCEVVSGAINGDAVLTIEASKLAKDSRYAKIMQVMDASKQRRPYIRRLGDSLGAWYTPLAVCIATLAWYFSGDASRFLGVLVVATPCPLLIAIPVAIIGSISLAAKRSIIIKDPAILEQLSKCRTIIFDKTGTLTYGEPTVAEVVPAPGFEASEVVRLAAALEQYSKHPLAAPVLAAAKEQHLITPEATAVHELPGQGLKGLVGQDQIAITGRSKLSQQLQAQLPAQSSGLECVILKNNSFAGLLRFHDVPRREGESFIGHLGEHHGLDRVMLLSGDRESEVRYLAEQVGIKEVFANKTPEEKVTIVREETRKRPTVFVGDGINDAPALLAATVGIAFGPKSDITSESAGAVVLDPSLRRIDELFHIGSHFRRIALQSAVGGMVLSIVGMILASVGLLPPVSGALTQEIIDLYAVVNSLRAASAPKPLSHV
ncbi:MAG: cadmium-translocating P-type ATPase [Oligoflexia bacterium]|nr:cadmium-translocating P-type ATPase [Oligoflexia bacterium]